MPFPQPALRALLHQAQGRNLCHGCVLHGPLPVADSSGAWSAGTVQRGVGRAWSLSPLAAHCTTAPDPMSSMC